MKVIPGIIVTNMRGIINRAAVMSANKNGLYMKGYKIPKIAINDQNSAVKARYSNIVRQWNLLTSADYLAWNTKALTYTFYDALGAPYVPSGWQLFVYCNMNLYYIEDYYVTVPVNSFDNGMPEVIFNTEWNIDDTFQISWTSPTSAEQFVIVKCSQMLNAGVTSKKQTMHYCSSFYGTETQPLDILPQLLLVLGTSPAAGKRILFEVTTTDSRSGVKGAVQSVFVNILAP